MTAPRSRVRVISGIALYEEHDDGVFIRTPYDIVAHAGHGRRQAGAGSRRGAWAVIEAVGADRQCARDAASQDGLADDAPIVDRLTGTPRPGAVMRAGWVLPGHPPAAPARLDGLATTSNGKVAVTGQNRRHYGTLGLRIGSDRYAHI